MTKPTAPYFATSIELPPVDEADAQARATRDANANAFFANFTGSESVDPEYMADLIDRLNAFEAEQNRVIIGMAITGKVDRPRFRALQAEQGRLRRELLLLIGADPDSDDLIERPVELHHS
jgi:hypothetical protein